MVRAMKAQRIEVPEAASLRDGATTKFRFKEGDLEREGFVIRQGEKLHAWRNECRHIPMTMDWVENRFLNREGKHIQCATHGALYEIGTGRCIWGPPLGESLRGFELEETEGTIFVVIEAVEDDPPT
jgi:nitrite reductase/ring-hydroxylating ferredoxin subunit